MPGQSFDHCDPGIWETKSSLVAGLEARGAHIQTVKVYRWDEDIGPLKMNIRTIVAGEMDVDVHIHHRLPISLTPSKWGWRSN